MSTGEREEFLRALGESLSEGTFVKLSLGKYRGEEADLRNVYARPVTIRKSTQLSLLYRYRTRDVVKNHPVEEALEVISGLLGVTFLSGHLFTLEQDLQLEFSRKLKPRLTIGGPTFTAPPGPEHDRAKRHLIELPGNVYLKRLGVTNERGEVRPRMGDKFRQINKFVEIVSGLYASSGLAGRQAIRIIDMGSGKGYLTFAVYDFFNRHLGIEAEVIGVEARPELVELGNRIAREAEFSRLRFHAGYIGDFPVESVDILIALHACNTATDEAIYKGVSAGASIIICAPCCHQQIRPQITAPEVLRGLLRHGILLEREAETATDGLRALLLERSGYHAKVFEFISTEHTQKNTMIVGVRHGREFDRTDIARQIEEIKRFYGITEHYLEKLLKPI